MSIASEEVGAGDRVGSGGGGRSFLVWVAIIALALFLFLLVLAVKTGATGTYSWETLGRGLAAWAGLGQELDAPHQAILRLRVWRALTAAGVGASLSLAGAYLQGLFRNGLASPSVVGVTAGSVLGASVAIALLGGFGLGLRAPGVGPTVPGPWTPFLVTVFALVGALAAILFVYSLASFGGRLSIPTLLLAGIAVNTLGGGLLAALQSITMRDFEVSRSILAWTFGTLDDRSGWQTALVWLGFALAAAGIPFVARELDLFGGGEEDAQSLGVDVQRVKLIVLGAAALSTAAAVSVAGQIPFLGLVVPHFCRMLGALDGGRRRGGHPGSNRFVLVLAPMLGALLLLGSDFLHRVYLVNTGLRPGVTMSLIGGPLFLFLLVKERRSILTW